jgi:hypothetical protein
MIKRKYLNLFVIVLSISILFSLVACNKNKEQNNNIKQSINNTNEEDITQPNLDVKDKDKLAKKVIKSYYDDEDPLWEYIHIPEYIKIEDLKQCYEEFKTIERFKELKTGNREDIWYDFEEDGKIYFKGLYAFDTIVQGWKDLKFELNGVDVDINTPGIEKVSSGLYVPFTLLKTKLIVKNEVLNDIVFEDWLENNETISPRYLFSYEDECAAKKAVNGFVGEFFNALMDYKRGKIDFDEFSTYFSDEFNLEEDISRIKFNEIFINDDLDSSILDDYYINECGWNSNDEVFLSIFLYVKDKNNPENVFGPRSSLYVEFLPNNEFKIASRQNANKIVYYQKPIGG